MVTCWLNEWSPFSCPPGALRFSSNNMKTQEIPALFLKGGQPIHLLARNHPEGRGLCNPEAFPNQLYPSRVRRPDWSEECLPPKLLQLPVLGMISHRSQRETNGKTSFLQSPSAPWALRFMKITVRLIQESCDRCHAKAPSPGSWWCKGWGRKEGTGVSGVGDLKENASWKKYELLGQIQPNSFLKTNTAFAGFPSPNSPAPSQLSSSPLCNPH